MALTAGWIMRGRTEQAGFEDGKLEPSTSSIGEMAEWLKAHAWKACLGETLTWVRIPVSPPVESTVFVNCFLQKIITNPQGVSLFNACNSAHFSVSVPLFPLPTRGAACSGACLHKAGSYARVNVPETTFARTHARLLHNLSR